MARAMTMILGVAISMHAAIAGVRFDPVAQARGGSWLRFMTDAWSTVSCPSLLADLSGFRMAAVHSPGMFGLRELSHSAVVASVATPIGGTGVAFSTFGRGRYRETGLTAAVGTAAGPVRFGGSLRIRNISIRGYGSATVAALDATLVFRQGDRILWGMKIVNLNRPALGASGERTGAAISGEITVSPADPVELTVHLGNEYDRPLSSRAGMSARLSPELVLLCGVSGDFTRVHAGMETDLRGLGIVYAVSVHPVLGWSHLFSLGVNFPE